MLLTSPFTLLTYFWNTFTGLIHVSATFWYLVLQWLLGLIFAPRPPSSDFTPKGPKIAVIGAGITGVSSAAHFVDHGFRVTIFEAGGRENLGGIWSRVDNTSSLQIHSIMYRFHPAVKFRRRYPDMQRIVEEVASLWHEYHLDDQTRFNEPVKSLKQNADTGKWIINEDPGNEFDGVVAAIGTCSDPKIIQLQGQEKFEGPIYHSSQLTDKDVTGKTVLIIGGGASALEAVEYAVANTAERCYILAKSEKWIIPRNPFIDALLAAGPLGRETSLSLIPEFLLRHLFYRDLKQISPPSASLYTETPMVNDQILNQIRKGKVVWLRGDTKSFTESGIVFIKREQGVSKGGPGKEQLVEGGICIMATGFHRPSLSFLPSKFQEPLYALPNWYLQTIPIGAPTICAINCTYVSGLGTVGNLHIGIYSRLLMMFLVDEATRPTPEWMRIWVDSTRWFKKRAPGGALQFFTMAELFSWFILSLVLNPYRWKWAPFVLCGFGRALPYNSLAHVDGDTNGTAKDKTYPFVRPD